MVSLKAKTNTANVYLVQGEHDGDCIRFTLSKRQMEANTKPSANTESNSEGFLLKLMIPPYKSTVEGQAAIIQPQLGRGGIGAWLGMKAVADLEEVRA